MNSYKYCCVLYTLNILIVYAHGHRIDNETGMINHACFYYRGKKKENSTKNKNERGDICFLNNNRFLYKIPFKVISFFVTVVTLCDIFILDLSDFFALMFWTKYDLA